MGKFNDKTAHTKLRKTCTNKIVAVGLSFAVWFSAPCSHREVGV